jgi:hypothetical protein
MRYFTDRVNCWFDARGFPVLGDNYPDRPATTILAAAERVAV